MKKICSEENGPTLADLIGPALPFAEFMYNAVKLFAQAEKVLTLCVDTAVERLKEWERESNKEKAIKQFEYHFKNKFKAPYRAEVQARQCNITVSCCFETAFCCSNIIRYRFMHSEKNMSVGGRGSTLASVGISLNFIKKLKILLVSTINPTLIL